MTDQTPRTDAGRRVTTNDEPRVVELDRGEYIVTLDDILAIEAEARTEALDVEVLDGVVDELRERGYVIPEASTIASTYHRAILAGKTE